MTKKNAKNKKAKSKAKPAVAEGQITAATTGSENEDESEIEFMDEEEFHEVMGTKRKYADTDPDSSTASKKEKSMHT